MNVETVCAASPLSAVQTSHFLSSSEVTTPWEWWWHRYPTSAPLPAPPQGPLGPHRAYLSAFSDGCPLDPQGLRRLRRRSRTDTRSWERGTLTALQKPRNEHSLLLWVKDALAMPQLILCFREGPSGQWIFAERRKTGEQTMSLSPTKKGVTGTKCLAMHSGPWRLIKPFSL